MLQELKTAPKVTGAKQVTRALKSDNVLRVYLAEDADPRITQPMEAICQNGDIPVEKVATMADLGAACGISVGSAVAAVLKA